MVRVIPLPPAAQKKHRRWRCHNTPCVVPTLVLPTSGTDGRRRSPATLSAWLPKLPRRHSTVCMSETYMTRKSKKEIVLFYATSLPCKSLALGHLSYYHIRSCHLYLASRRCHTPVVCTLMPRQPCHLQQRQDVSVCCTVRWLYR